MNKHILLINGNDTKGLIFTITKILFEYNCNIISQEEYVSPDKFFFLRTEFESDDNIDVIGLQKTLSDSLDESMTIRINPKKKKEIVVFVTKEHHCIAELLTGYYFNELNANILAVIGNYRDLEPFVSKFDIPFHYISHENLTREDYEAQIKVTLENYNPEYLVLAKYMRILTSDFTKRYSNQIINIHHSFLPAFIGANPYKQAYERGVKIIGATSHFVNENLDEGPIITQSVKDVDHAYTVKSMSKEGKDIEKQVLIKALELVFNDRVFIHNNKTIIL